MPVQLGTASISQIWNEIMSIFTSEMNVGPTGAGTGENTTGRLQTVVALQRSIAVGPAFPAIGVQFRKQSRTFDSSNRMKFSAKFLILIAVEAAMNSNGLVLLDQANAQLEAIADDGNGNGIDPILLDPKNYGLNGLALTTYISDWEYAWEDPAATDNAPRAYAVATYEVNGYILRR